MARGKTLRFFAAVTVAAVAFMVMSPSVQAGSDDDERVIGAIFGSVLGGAIGSTIGSGADRGLAIGVGSLLGGIAGYHAVDPEPYPHHRRRHRHLRPRHHLLYDYPVFHAPLLVQPRLKRRERHVHHHYYEAPAQPQTVMTYQPLEPAVSATPVRSLNVSITPRLGRSSRSLNTKLSECRVLEGGIAPVYACRTVGGDWAILK